MMLFWIEIDGVRVAVQAVNRKPKPYWRLAPYTLVYPTPKQRMVRFTVASGAHKAAGGTSEDVTTEVAMSFRGWEYVQRTSNSTEAALRELYGDQVDEVMAYIRNSGRVREKLNSPLYREHFDRIVEKMLIEQ